MERPSVGNGPVLGPDPAADRARRLAGARRLARRGRARQAHGRARAAGTAVVPFEQGRRGLVLKNSLPGQARPAAGAGRGPAQAVPAAGANGSRHDPAPARPARERRKRLRPLVQAGLEPAEMREALQGPEAPALPLPARGRRAVPGGGPAAAGRRHGAGQDRAGDRLLRHPLAHRPGSPRPDHRPGQPQAAVGPRVGRFSDLPIQSSTARPTNARPLYARRKSTGSSSSTMSNCSATSRSSARWDPDLVVLDEAQRIKNWATKTALSVKGLTPPYRLVLTGTPMENRIEELASIVEWVDDMALEPKWRLAPLHAIRADGRREIVGVRHLDTIRDRLRHCMVRRVRQDVLDQLPPRTDTRVPDRDDRRRRWTSTTR